MRVWQWLSWETRLSSNMLVILLVNDFNAQERGLEQHKIAFECHPFFFILQSAYSARGFHSLTATMGGNTYMDTYRHTETHTEIHTDTHRLTEIHTDSQRYIQTHTDSLRYIQTHRDTYRHTDSLRYIQTHTDSQR